MAIDRELCARLALVAALALCVPARALAQAPERPGPPPAPPSHVAVILASDAAAAALFLSGIAVLQASEERDGEGWASGTLVLLGMGTYLFTSPILYRTHHQTWRAWVCFALRAVLPLSAGLIGNAVWDDFSSTLVFSLSGVALALALDVFVLARPWVVNRRTSPRARR